MSIQKRARNSRRHGALAPLLFAGALLSSGCGTFSMFGRSAAEEMASIDSDPRYGIGGIHGPTERELNGRLWKRQREDLAQNADEKTKAALAQFDTAQVLYDNQKYAEAEKAFKKVAKERRDLYESFGAKFNRAWGIKSKDEYDPYSNFGDPIEEDAIFMTAQSQFAQKRYAQAQDSYNDLLARYPSSRHLDEVTRGLFRIARYWLDFPDDVGPSGEAEIRLANNDQPTGSPEAPKKQPGVTTRVPVLPNLTDSTRPLFDTYGRGKQALRSIWLHDSTGKLADDALMLAASHSLRTEDFVEARRLYSLLRENYPDSPHLKDAFYLGSHVSLASYQGAAYDGQSLEDASELKETMLHVFADLSPDTRKQLEQEVSVLKEAQVARMWDIVEFYQAKRQDPAVALHCNVIINKYPDSIYAERARETLGELEEKYRNKKDSSWPWRSKTPVAAKTPPPPQQQQKTAEAPPAQVQPPAGVAPVPVPSEAPAPQQDRSWWRNPLRRAEEAPKLQPVEPNTTPDTRIPTTNDNTFPGRASLEQEDRSAR